jgi:NADH:ubiquinone oxidoreductase subunit H
VARRLRGTGLKSALFALFGRGPRAIFSVLASVLLATFALGPHVASADLDGGLLLVAAIALLVGSRVAETRGAMASVRAAADVGIAGLVLAAAVAGVVVHGGALQLAEIVRVQGGAPWEFAAVRQPVACALAFAYVGALLVLLRAREEMPLLADARSDDSSGPPAAGSKTALGAGANGRLLERLGLLVASALGVAIFFGGWQLPGGVEARSTLLQAVAALLFVIKTWALCASLLGLASIASPWTARESRIFVLRRLLPALAVGGLLAALSRRLPPSEALEAALGATVVTALVLLLLRAGLRIRGAMQRPEPHASPFL